MDKSSSEAPSPDPKIGEAALKQAQTGEDWLGFAKDSLAVSTARQADLDALTKQVTQQQMGIANDQAAWAKSDRERYDTVFKPVEDKFVAEASAYGSEAHQNEAAAEAKADVQNNAAGARGCRSQCSFHGHQPDVGQVCRHRSRERNGHGACVGRR